MYFSNLEANEQDASTVSISIRPSDTIHIVGLKKTFGESRGGVVLWKMRYGDVDSVRMMLAWRAATR
jgi:hypothetical protein